MKKIAATLLLCLAGISIASAQSVCPTAENIKAVGLSEFQVNGPDEDGMYRFYMNNNYATELDGDWHFTLSTRATSRTAAYHKALAALSTISETPEVILEKRYPPIQLCRYHVYLNETYAVATHS